jgi:hypothetical protein
MSGMMTREPTAKPPILARSGEPASERVIIKPFRTSHLDGVDGRYQPRPERQIDVPAWRPELETSVRDALSGSGPEIRASSRRRER